MPHSLRLLPTSVVPIAAKRTLPRLPEIDFVVIGPGRHQPVADTLTTSILHRQERSDAANRI